MGELEGVLAPARDLVDELLVSRVARPNSSRRRRSNRASMSAKTELVRLPKVGGERRVY